MKVLIIGLDGATLDLIEPWVKAGELPTFEKIMSEGSYGTLRSTLPPTTIPAWISLGTGNNPGRFGLYYMNKLSEDRKVKPNPPILKDYGFFWSKIAEKYKVGLLNIPFIRTKLKTGFCVPGRLPLDSYPKSVKEKLPAWEDLQPDWSKGEEYNLKILKKMVENQTENIRYALREWDLDLLFAFYVATDTIQHQFWGYMDETHRLYKESKYKNEILNLYKKIDSALAEILGMIDEETNLLMLSDHGFQAYEYSIPINHWLRKEGYLKLKEDNEEINSHFDRLLKKGYDYVQDTFLEKFVPSKIKTQAVDGFFPLIDKAIDWDRSVAFAAHGGGGIYVEEKEIEEEISEKLLEIKNPYTGENAIRKAYSREEVYHGKYINKAPNILAVPQEQAWIVSRLGYDSTVIERPSIMSGSGTHARDGMIITSGPDFERGADIEADIMDIAPTMLEMFDEGGIEDMDGEALEEVL